jgi:hypothetical protein
MTGWFYGDFFLPPAASMAATDAAKRRVLEKTDRCVHMGVYVYGRKDFREGMCDAMFTTPFSIFIYLLTKPLLSQRSKPIQ